MMKEGEEEERVREGRRVKQEELLTSRVLMLQVLYPHPNVFACDDSDFRNNCA